MNTRPKIRLTIRRNLQLIPCLIAALIFGSTAFILNSCNRTESHWLKGNLHTHTFWSDGDEFPEEVARWYKENGYDFLALTDHNVILEGERWREFPNDHPVLQEYRQTYGDEWVEVQPAEEDETKNRVRLKTLEEFRSRYEEPGKFLLIMGNEISNPHAVHMLAIHQDRVIPAIKGNRDERERMIFETVENLKTYRKETGRKVHPVLAHPNFTWAITAEMMLQVPELRYFEVYNGHPQVHNEGDQDRVGTEKIWDIVLANRLAAGKGELLMGLATDDAHNYHGGSAGPGKGWIRVRSEELSPEAILEAIDKGDFYASTGVELKDIRFNGNRLSLEIEPQEGVEYKTEFIGTLKGADLKGVPTTDSEGQPIENTTRTYSDEIGQVLAVSNDLNPSYTFTGEELYVRARVVSTADQMDPNSGKLLGKQKAWIQPCCQNQKK